MKIVVKTFFEAVAVTETCYHFTGVAHEWCGVLNMCDIIEQSSSSWSSRSHLQLYIMTTLHSSTERTGRERERERTAVLSRMNVPFIERAMDVVMFAL